MAIRKFGTEPASAEVREEDNDPETLATMKAQAAPAADQIDVHPETGVLRERH